MIDKEMAAKNSKGATNNRIECDGEIFFASTHYL